LSLLFTDELAVFAWQLSCYLKDNRPEEAAALTAEETAAFYREKRNILLSLSSGDALISLVSGKAKEPQALPAYFSSIDISGVIDETSEGITFLIFNPRTTVKIISIHRDTGKQQHIAFKGVPV
jgi:hypothetical protein